jgi:hypothetical protein
VSKIVGVVHERDKDKKPTGRVVVTLRRPLYKPGTGRRELLGTEEVPADLLVKTTCKDDGSFNTYLQQAGEPVIVEYVPATPILMGYEAEWQRAQQKAAERRQPNTKEAKTGMSSYTPRISTGATSLPGRVGH